MLHTAAKSKRFVTLVLALAISVVALTAGPAMAAAPLPGAIFTTDEGCTGVDLNIYGSKTDVYLDGGPAHPGAASLPDGSYFVRVTDPSGSVVLGQSSTAVFVVSGGEPADCYQLASIVNSASSAFADPGYDDTPNSGAEYKVWVSTDETFANDSTKTDNFKVKSDGQCTEHCTPPHGTVNVNKCYDVNVDGFCSFGETLISGWKFNIHDGINWDRFTPASMVLDPDDYTVTEYSTVESNWIHTGLILDGNPAGDATHTTVTFGLVDGQTSAVQFANVCIGAGGGLTLGFWSNKNGEKAQFGTTAQAAATLAFLSSLNLRNAIGTNFDPSTYSAFRSWLLSASATNMAYMLSAQLAAMELNVRNGNVSGGALIYAPGTTSANATGFATVNGVMDEANTELGLHGSTVVAGPIRTYQEAVKNALDKANNNLTFVQSSPCAFTFPG